ncbi:MAG TPA: hypothetical protein VF017_22100 [Thermoanaerobaculia bacterium]|nr:hypothetical protein [Thermoanaerobaculia bacterium]
MSSPKPWNPKEVEDLLVSSQIPEPPADLADRIKAEIPLEITGLERSHHHRGASWRALPAGQLVYLAASLATLAVAGTLAWRSMEIPRGAAAVLEPVAAEKADAQNSADEPLDRLGRELGEASRHLEAARRAHEEARAQAAQSIPEAPAPRAETAPGYLVPSSSSPEPVAPPSSPQRLAAAAAPMPAPPESALTRARQDAPAVAAEIPSRPVLVGQLGGAGYVETESEPFSVLGMAPAGASFDRARRFLDRGLLPPREAVDIAAFVNEVELGPPSAPAPVGRLELEVEGAPPVFAGRGERRLLRVSLRGQGTPAEIDVRVELNPRVVSRWHLLTQGSPESEPAALPGPESAGARGAAVRPVTALYELELAPRPMPTEILATVYLRYRERGAERPLRQKRIVQLADFAPTWQEASSGMRLASLAAELGELLRRTGGSRSADSGELSRRARQLAVELVGRRDAAELAALAGKVADLLSTQPAEEPRM